MMTFHLQIVTPDGLIFDGQAEKLTVRTVTGEIGILPRHIDYVTSLGMGEASITIDGKSRTAACIGGMLAIVGGDVKLVATTFEWADAIDRNRAKQSEERARAVLKDKTATGKDLQIAEARLKRALVRQGVSERSK